MIIKMILTNNRCLVRKCRKQNLTTPLCDRHHKLAEHFSVDFEAARKEKRPINHFIVDSIPLEVIEYVLKGHSGPTREEIMSWATGRIKEDKLKLGGVCPNYEFIAKTLLDDILAYLEKNLK